MANKILEGINNIKNRVNYWRRVDPSTDDYHKFSKKNRFMGFLVEFFNPLTFIVSAPEILLAINGIFAALGIAFLPLMLGFFALEIALFTVIAGVMGYKYIKESGEANKDISQIQKFKQEIEGYNNELSIINKKISGLEKTFKDNSFSELSELATLKQELKDAADKKRHQKYLMEKATKIVKAKNRNLFQKIIYLFKTHLEGPYYKIKKKHPNIIGAIHYLLNFGLALITVTGFISGLGFVFGISATSLGILTLGLIPIGATNPIGWAILLGGLAICAAVFIGRRMFFHAPVSEAKRRMPERKQELGEQAFEKKLELDVAKGYLEKLEEKVESKSTDVNTVTHTLTPGFSVSRSKVATSPDVNSVYPGSYVAGSLDSVASVKARELVM